MATWTAPGIDVPDADRVTDVLLVGGGVASARCARTLRRNGFTGSILLVGNEGRIPYNRPPLSKEVLREDLPDELLDAEPPAWYDRREIQVELGVHVQRLDANAGRATLDGGQTVRFERALLATGAEVRHLAVPGVEASLTLRTANDAHRLRAAAMAAGEGAPAVIVGGGFIGLEVASSLASVGLRPIVIERADRLWAGTLGTELAAWAAERLGAAGVELRLGTTITRIAGGAAWVGDERLPAAFVVVGVGVSPRIQLAEAAGLRVDDGIVVDAAQRTDHPAVWAAGDAARIEGSQRIEHWHAAREGGERAALSMLGLPVPAPPAPWVFSEIGGTTIDVIGVSVGWDEESWLDDARSVLAYIGGGRVIGLAVIDGALAPDVARRLIEAGATPSDVANALSEERSA